MLRETLRNIVFALLFYFTLSYLHLKFFLFKQMLILISFSIINPQILSTLAHLSYCGLFKFRTIWNSWGCTWSVRIIMYVIYFDDDDDTDDLSMQNMYEVSNSLRCQMNSRVEHTSGSRWELEVNLCCLFPMSDNLPWLEKIVSFSYLMTIV